MRTHPGGENFLGGGVRPQISGQFCLWEDMEVASWCVILYIPLFSLFCTEYRLHCTVRSSNYFLLVSTFLFCSHLINFLVCRCRFGNKAWPRDMDGASWCVTLNMFLFLLFCTEYWLHCTVRSINYFLLVNTFLFCPHLFHFTCFFVADLTTKFGHVALAKRASWCVALNIPLLLLFCPKANLLYCIV